MLFHLLDSDNYDLRALLSEHVPSAILATVDGSMQEACIKAAAIVQGRNPEIKRVSVLLMDPEHRDNQQTTRYYHQQWCTAPEGGKRRAYGYRIPCGNWQACTNPEGVCTGHYAAPGKFPKRTGPAICRYCWLEHGHKPETRRALIARNVARGKSRNQ